MAILKHLSLRLCRWSQYVYWQKCLAQACSTSAENHSSMLRASDLGKTDSSDNDSSVDGGGWLAGEQIEEVLDVYSHSREERARNDGQAVEKLPGQLYERYLMSPDTPPDGKLLKVAILGAPNAGKSTFINKLVGWKVNSVSKKVHTTKWSTNTVMMADKTQIVFTDTPGVITLKEKKKHMVDVSVHKEPEESLQEADIVGIIVDGENKWTRNTLHSEIIKALHLHKNVPAFLIINKVDSVPKKLVLLQTIKHLTEGLVDGKPFYTNPYRRDKPLPKKPQKLFTHLEEKYGELRLTPGGEEAEQALSEAKTETSQAEVAYKRKSVEENTDKKKRGLLDMKVVTLKDLLKVKEKDPLDNENSYTDTLTDPQTHETTDTLTDPQTHETTNTLTDPQTHETKRKGENETSISINAREDLNADSGTSVLKQSTEIAMDSYQSDFVKRVLSLHHPEYEQESSSRETEEDRLQRELLKEAVTVSRTRTSWPGFKRVFIISALNGTGVEDVKEYLLSAARPGQWLFHSSMITEQHPYEIAKLCVRQALLDNVHGWLPYKIDPLISHWDVSSDDTLHVSIDIIVKSSNHLGLIVGMNSDTIKAVSYDAKQALMDAFHCDVKLRLSATARKPRASTTRNITFY